MDIQMRIPEDDLPCFLAYLGLGTLYAIRRGIVPPQTGIWTLARPNVWEFLLKRPNIPRSLIKVFQTADELSGIQAALPDRFDNEANKLMERLQAELTKMKDPTWRIEWGSNPERPSTAARRKQSRPPSHPTRKRQKKKRA